MLDPNINIVHQAWDWFKILLNDGTACINELAVYTQLALLFCLSFRSN